jgi:predicted enzyme related to lactoylglutathione lyase
VGAEDRANIATMKMIRQVIVFDASDMEAESAFWAGMLGGRVLRDDDWHNVIDADDRWVMGVQLAPNHVPPEWPDGSPQQIHLDLHVEDFPVAHEQAMALGARVLKPAADLTADEGYQVYADPAGHPFCLGWGQPSEDAVRRYVRSVTDA